MNKTKVLRVSLLAFVGLNIAVTFQNCAGMVNPLDSKNSSEEVAPTLDTSTEHPSGSIVQPSSQGPLLANRYQIQSLLLDTFKDPTVAEDSGNNRVLSKILVDTIVKRAGVYGLPCDAGNPMLDVASGDDCDGTIVAPMTQPATTMRAAYKIQACEQILSKDVFVTNLLNKLGGATTEVNETSASILWQYFYRGDDIEPQAIAGLLKADEVSKAQDAKITLMNRWRLLMTVVCESTGWEML